MRIFLIKFMLAALGYYDATSDQHRSLVMQNTLVLKNNVFDKFLQNYFKVIFLLFFRDSSEHVSWWIHWQLSSFCDICGINDTKFDILGHETGECDKILYNTLVAVTVFAKQRYMATNSLVVLWLYCIV